MSTLSEEGGTFEETFEGLVGHVQGSSHLLFVAKTQLCRAVRGQTLLDRDSAHQRLPSSPESPVERRS